MLLCFERKGKKPEKSLFLYYDAFYNYNVSAVICQEFLTSRLFFCFFSPFYTKFFSVGLKETRGSVDCFFSNIERPTGNVGRSMLERYAKNLYSIITCQEMLRRLFPHHFQARKGILLSACHYALCNAQLRLSS